VVRSPFTWRSDAPFTVRSSDGQKPVYWANDGETDGHSIRSGTLPCAAIAGPPPALAEFPIAVLPAGVLALIGAGFVARRRRRWVVQPQT
jgi:hypothetical protein